MIRNKINSKKELKCYLFYFKTSNNCINHTQASIVNFQITNQVQIIQFMYRFCEGVVPFEKTINTMMKTYKYRKCGVSSDICYIPQNDKTYQRVVQQGNAVKISSVPLCVLGASRICCKLQSGGYQKQNTHHPLTTVISISAIPSYCCTIIV